MASRVYRGKFHMFALYRSKMRPSYCVIWVAWQCGSWSFVSFSRRPTISSRHEGAARITLEARLSWRSCYSWWNYDSFLSTTLPVNLGVFDASIFANLAKRCVRFSGDLVRFQLWILIMQISNSNISLCPQCNRISEDEFSRLINKLELLLSKSAD